MKDIDGSDALGQAWFISKLRKRHGVKIFDFGCGPKARFSIKLIRMGFDVYGNDILPPKFQQAKRNFPYIRQIKKNLHYMQGDITDMSLKELQAQDLFDFIVNLSSIEHAGLIGRYESKDEPDQDLRIMQILQKIIKSDGIHLLQIPIGVDDTIGYYHRIYGEKRLPRLLEGWQIEEEDYWKKNDDGKNLYQLTYREDCLKEKATKIAPHYYAFGCFQLKVAK